MLSTIDGTLDHTEGTIGLELADATESYHSNGQALEPQADGKVGCGPVLSLEVSLPQGSEHRISSL